jgi:1-deoxy-D-xylulose-5-phosphate reductoisomerase
MTTLTVLGSTGSIGRNTLKVVARFPGRFQVKALTAKFNLDLLTEQVITFQPEIAVVFDAWHARQLEKSLPAKAKTSVLYGPEGYQAAAVLDGVDMVVGAMVGAAGLAPTLAAIAAGKDVALANKETLVMAGALVMQAVAKNKIHLLPIDSEHSAIFQCLQGNHKEDLHRIFLTASGGPFRKKPFSEFATISPAEALKHPNWRMGNKITIDSATLMNKGLEVIEAKWLFDLNPEQIQVLIHPQSIIHSMVAFYDGSVLAQLGIPDMQEAIAYALSYPRRLPLHQPLPDFVRIQSLTFENPDLERFPCLDLAFKACRIGGTMPAVLNAANEVAVDAFLAEQITFLDLPRIIAETMAEHTVEHEPDLSGIMQVDAWARQSAKIKVDEIVKSHLQKKSKVKDER